MRLYHFAVILLMSAAASAAIMDEGIKAPLFDWDEWNRKENRDEFARIVNGDLDTAIANMSDYLAKHPDNQECMFGLAAAYAQKGDIDTAMYWMKKSLDAGILFERFLIGPRDILLPLTQSEEFREFAKTRGDIELLHGPMLGCVTDNSAKFWVRTLRDVPIQVLVSESENMNAPLESAVVKTNPQKEYTAIASIDGLKPSTVYYYQLIINGKKLLAKWSFCTFPPEGQKARFDVSFGGCAAYYPPKEKMWHTILSHNPLAFLMLGDNVYIDHPTMRAVQQYCYYRRQSRPEFRDLTGSVPVFSIYDDHDFTVDDGWCGPEIYHPWWKISVWQTFCNNFNNPGYGGGETQPGCWYNFSIGNVDFFMLDGRYYRTDPKSENPSMLGPVQKAWLKERLKASKAVFKVIASPVSWSRSAKPGSPDTWDGFTAEREEIFSFINDNKIDGAILLSADRHRADIRITERERGYPLYDFENSRLTNIHAHDVPPGAVFGYNEDCMFGLFTFDTTLNDPRITYRIITVDDAVVHEMTLKKSELTHK